MGYIIDKSKKKATNNTSKSYIIGKLNPSWEEKQKTVETQKLSNNQKIVSSYEPPKNYEVIPNLLPQSPKANNFVPNISFNDVSKNANVNVPGFNLNLGNKVSNPMTMLKPNLGQNYEKEIVSKAGEFIGNIPLSDPVTYGINKLLGTDNYFRVKDLARLSDASMALGEKTPSFIDYARENAKPSNTIRGLNLPSNNNALNYATFTKQQAQNKLNNSLEALKGKYSPNPLRLGATEKQVARFEAKDTMPALTQVGKLGISGVMDPLNFVGADLISGLSKGKKIAKIADNTEFLVKELADKENFLQEFAPRLRKNAESFLQESKLRQTPQGKATLNFGKQLALPAANDTTKLLPESNKIFGMPAVNPKTEFETLKNTMVSKYTNAYDNVVEQIQNKVGNYELNAAEQAKYSDLIQQATDNIQKADYYTKLTPEKLRGKLNAGVIEPEELDYFDRIRQYSEAKSNLKPSKALQKEIKPIEPNYNLAKGMSEQPKKVLQGELINSLELPKLKQNVSSDINTLPINNKLLESQIKPNYDTSSKGLLNNQTGGVKNIFGAERSTKEFNTINSDTVDMIKDKPKVKSSGLYDSIKTKFFNSQNTLSTKGFKQAFGDMPEKLASNTANNRNIASHVLESKLVNKDGIPIADSFKSIVDDIPKKSQTMVEDYLLHKHNISRMEQNKPIFGNDVTSEMSKAKVEEYEAAVPELKEISNKLNNWMNTFMETWGVDTGLISRDTWTKLKEMYPDYVPTYRIFDEVESVGKFGSSKGFADQSKIIKGAKGSSRDIQSPLSKITELVDNTIRASKNNQVMQNIVDTIRANPEGTAEWGKIIQQPKNELIENINKTLEESGIEGVIKEFANQYDTVFSKSKLDKANVVRVMVNGEPVYVEIKNTDFLKAVTGLTTSNIGETERFGRAMTGWFKGLITGYNPIFTVKNIARDLPTAYINGVESNPAKFLLDIKDAVKEIKTNGKMWQEYKGMGGGGGGFFQADKTLDRKLYGNFLDRAKSGIEKVNTTTEAMPRFAEYMKVAKKYGNTAEGKVRGLFAANDLTVNFSRKGGSDIVRIADAFTPYLNAGLQGIDNLFRQLTTSPSQFFKTIGKAGFVIATPTVGLYMLNKDNKYYQQLDNRTKDTYFCIPNVLDKDENGNAKTFIKIPKTREYGAIFGALFERGLRQAFGEKDSYKGIGNTIATNFAPANPITDSIAAPIINLRANKDFADRTIVPQSLQTRSPELQYDEQSTELSKKIGKLGISPKQIDYLINSYSGIVGQVAMPIMQNKSTAVSAPADILKKNFVADPLYSNQLSSDFYENKKQLETKRSDYKTLNPKDKKKYKDLTLTKVTKEADKASDIYDKIDLLDPVKDRQEIRKLKESINTIYGNANKLMKP